jgi:hypothetical protein
MISKKQAASLQVGDVVLYNGSPRIVRAVSAQNNGMRISITFAIKRRSWTNRIQTVQGYHDIKHKISLPQHHRLSAARVAMAESDMLSANKFNVVAELKREIAEEINIAIRMQRKPKKKVIALARRALACAIRKSRKEK